MAQLPSPQSFKFASLYSLKDSGSEAGASQDKAVSTVWQDISKQQSLLRLRLWSPQLSLQEKGWVVDLFLPFPCSLPSRLCTVFRPCILPLSLVPVTRAEISLFTGHWAQMGMRMG